MIAEAAKRLMLQSHSTVMAMVASVDILLFSLAFYVNGFTLTI